MAIEKYKERYKERYEEESVHNNVISKCVVSSSERNQMDAVEVKKH